MLLVFGVGPDRLYEERKLGRGLSVLIGQATVIDINAASGKLVFGAMADFECGLISERSIAGLVSDGA